MLALSIQTKAFIEELTGEKMCSRLVQGYAKMVGHLLFYFE
jgi:hypothetical protein